MCVELVFKVVKCVSDCVLVTEGESKHIVKRFWVKVNIYVSQARHENTHRQRAARDTHKHQPHTDLLVVRESE